MIDTYIINILFLQVISIIKSKQMIQKWNQIQLKKYQQQKDGQSILKLLQNQQQNNPSTGLEQLYKSFIPSNHFNSYLRYLYQQQSSQYEQNKLIPLDFIYKRQSQITRLKNILKNNNILYNSSAPFQKQIEIIVLRSCVDCTLIGAKWGRISMQISLHRVYLNSKDIHNTNILGHGCFSKIFTVYHRDKEYAIKSILLDPKTSKQQVRGSQLVNAISQYFLSKIASCLEVGAKLQSIFGFDIIIYNDCAEFSMELCDKLDINHQNYKVIEEQLKQNLKLLHLLNISHSDIKPQNIIQSPSCKKPVFIDFGLSNIFIEGAGYKSLTNFIGTYVFCSDDMKLIYSRKKKEYIDMYFNDTECLQETIRVSLVNVNVKNQDWFKSVSDKSRSEKFQIYLQNQPSWTKYLINFFQINWLIFNQDYNSALMLISKQKYLLKTVNKVFQQKISCNTSIIDKINRKSYGLALKNMQKAAKLQKTIIFDQTMLQYLDDCEEKNSSKMYISYFMLILKDAKQIKGLQDKRFCLERLSQFLSPKNDPTCTQLKNYRNITRNNFIQLAYKQIQMNNRIRGLQKIRKQPTFIYKSYKILKILLVKVIQTRNQKILHHLKYCFMVINDYAGCVEVQNAILDLIKQENQWFFVARVLFFLDRKKWLSNAHIYCNQQWLQQVKNKLVQSNNNIALQLKSLAITILSTRLSKQCRGKYLKCSQIIQKVLQKYQILSQLRQKLAQIDEYCLSMHKIMLNCPNLWLSQEIFMKEQICITQDNQFQSASSLYVEDYMPYKGGFFNAFRMLCTFENSQPLIDQFMQTAKNNKIILKYQIQRILGNNYCFNIKAKIQLFKIYLQIVQINISVSNLQIIQMLSMFISVFKDIMLYIEKKSDITAINVEVNDQFWVNAKKFFTSIMEVIQNKKNSQQEQQQHIPQSLIIVAKYLVKYIPKKINQLINMFLKQLKIFKIDQYTNQSNSAVFYNHKFILLQLKFLYRVFDYRGIDINQLIIYHFDKCITFDSVFIMISMPDIVPIVIKIHLQKMYPEQKLIQLLFTLALNYGKNFTNCSGVAINYSCLQYMLIQALQNIFQECKISDVQFFVDQLLRKYRFSQILTNHLLVLMYVYIFFYSRKAKINLDSFEVQKFFIITNLSIAYMKSPRLRSCFTRLIYKQYRKLYIQSTERKDICLGKRQVKACSIQSWRKISKFSQNNIKIGRVIKANNMDLQQYIRQLLSQKLQLVKKVLSQAQQQFLDLKI